MGLSIYNSNLYDAEVYAGGYLNGLAYLKLDDDNFRIGTGQSMLRDMPLAGPLSLMVQIVDSPTVNMDTVGLNGLDQGVRAANTWYNVFVIHNPGTNVTGGLISTDPDNPVRPAGFGYIDRVGVFLTGAAAEILDFAVLRFDGARGGRFYVLGQPLQAATNVALTGVLANQATLMPPMSDTWLGALLSFNVRRTVAPSNDEINYFYARGRFEGATDLANDSDVRHDFGGDNVGSATWEAVMKTTPSQNISVRADFVDAAHGSPILNMFLRGVGLDV